MDLQAVIDYGTGDTPVAPGGQLPHYSFIEPDHMFGYSSSQHPGNNIESDDDFLAGENLIRQTYEALRSHPETWNHCLFLITYDEHGGFFDREPPPQDPAFEVAPIHSDGDHEFRFDLLGPRVPAVVVSPYIEPGTVDDTLYDHTSIPKTIREIQLPGSSELSPREGRANAFSEMISRETPRDAVQLPEPTERLIARAARAEFPPTEFPPSQAILEIDEFQESLLWLSEKIDSQLASDDEITAGTGPIAAPLEEAVTRERIIRAQNLHQPRFRRPDARLILLRSLEQCLERPSTDQVREFLASSTDARLWLEDVGSETVLERTDDGMLRYYEEDVELSCEADTQLVQTAFEAFRQGRIPEVKALIRAQE